MKIKGLDGREYSWSLVDKQRGKVSQYHERARKLIKDIYPLDKVYEEQTLPGSKVGQLGVLYADFYLHSKRLIIEVQGQQHGKFNSFFHSNKLDFFKAQTRDRNKKEWCEINAITLIELPYNESDEQWRGRIIGNTTVESNREST